MEDPKTEDLKGDLEFWDFGDLEASDSHFTDSVVEAFVHPKTGTAARIMEQEERYSVQPVMGDFGPFDNVVQSEDPNETVSGWASVVALDVDGLIPARQIAYAWIDAWRMRGELTGNESGDVIEK